MSEKTINGKTLAEWLQVEAGAEVDAVVHWLATGDDLKAREREEDIGAALETASFSSAWGGYLKRWPGLATWGTRQAGRCCVVQHRPLPPVLER